MSYTALYRKFRPNTFADVKGQDTIVATLKNQLRANRIGHAYLFTGTRGTGKTTVAKIFARMVNCENPTADGPCGNCPSCRAIAAGASMNVIEIDAASNNGVDNIRQIVEEVAYSPAQGKYKVYIIDEVHMLSIGAFNALLKTLEEPPSYVIFILATTEVHKIPVTILSRCQRYDFKRISIETITERLEELVQAEGVEAEEKALRYIARAADGSMRDALSLLDQCIAFHPGELLTYDEVLEILGAVDTEVFGRLLSCVRERDVPGCINLLEEVTMQGRELGQFVSDFTWYLRNLMLLQVSDDLEDVIDMSSENLAQLKKESALLSPDQVIRYIHCFSDLSGQLRYATQKRVLVEIALIRLCRPAMETSQEGILDRIRAVEEKLENGIVVTGEGAEAFARESSAANEGGTGGSAKKVPTILPEAVPEDIREIVNRWKSVVEQADNPLKIYLRNVRLSLDNDGSLLVVAEDGQPFDYLSRQQNLEQLKKLLADFSGKAVPVKVVPIREEENFERNYVDLSQVIQMKVEEEE